MTNAKHIPRRLLALVLVIAMLASFAVPVAFATDEYPSAYPDLKVTHTKSGYEWGALNAEKTEWGITVYGRSPTGSYQPNLKFTNTGSEEKTLSFDLSAVFGEGAANAQVYVAKNSTSGTRVLEKSASFENEHVEVSMAPNAVVYVVSKSSTGTSIPLTVTLTNLKFIAPERTVTTTFLTPENGSYTVDGEAITADTSFEKDASEGYDVVATPAEGYQFYAWYEKNTDRILSTAAAANLSLDNDSVISALFVPAVAEGDGVFGVEVSTGTVPFVRFADAAGFAAAMERPQITLLKNHTLTESITIPGGVTLLIPFDDAHTLYTDVPEIDTKTVLLVTSPAAYVTPSAYRTLTLASGVTVTVENGGGLSLSSKISAVGTGAKSYNGTPTGPDGRIVMEGSSAIEVQNGGSLYAYGFISGSGTVHAASGATVYECFQIRNWRGGNATLTLAGSDVFPISMYYVQNIEVPLTLDAGAKEIARSAVNASSTAMGAGVTFIGEGGMFQVTEGSVTKQYVPATDRLEITLNGDAAVTSIQLKIPEMETMLPEGIDSANFALPINNNITVNCADGSEVMLHQDMALLPGAVFNIAEGATVTLGSDTEVYVYDSDDYLDKGYVAGHDSDNSYNYIPVGYSASNGTADVRSDADLVDAKVNVNGTVVVNGGLYTTEGGGAIVSEGKTGKVIFTNGAGELTTTHMATQSGNVASVVDVAVTTARLQHGDGTYLGTEAAETGDVYPYSAGEDKWIEPFHGITVSFDPNGGEGEMDPILIPYDEAEGGAYLPFNEFARNGYVFIGWSEDPDCAVEDVWRYEDDYLDVVEFGTNKIVLYAIWEKLPTYYTVTFLPNGGEGTMEPQQFLEGEEQMLTANAFTREGYDFLGWAESADGPVIFEDGQLTALEEDLTLYAIWQKNHYTLTFHSNYEPDETVTQDFPLNANSVTLRLNSFTREGYAFLGWGDEPGTTTVLFSDGQTVGFDGDTDLYAVWEKNTFQVFFNANGGEGEMAPLTVVRETSTPLPANTFTREGYDFIGWSTEPDGQVELPDGGPLPPTDAIEDFTLYAQWQIRMYTITFKNDDGTVLESFMIEHGDTPAYTGTEPAKDATPKYTFTFKGWTPAIAPATQDMTYFAEYNEIINTYTITWKNENGDTLKTEQVAYDEMPVYTGETPTKEGTTQYSYSFAGWTPEVAAVTSDATYTATFTETVNKYTIKFVNEDGTELQSSEVAYGETPAYEGETPTKNPGDGYVYTFTGWTPALEAVTGEATYTAVYTKRLEDGYYLHGSHNGWDLALLTPEDKFEKNTGTSDNEWMLTVDLAKGESFKVIRYENGNVTWFPEGSGNDYVVDIHHAGDHKPVYFRPNYDGPDEWHYKCIYVEPRTYTVTFLNEDDTELQSSEVAYGKRPVYEGETPTKAATAQYSYTFAGWTDGESTYGPNDELPAVTGNKTYVATYSSTVNKYTIKFVNEDGTELQSSEVEYGETPAYTGETPTKAATAQYTYSFTGWTPEIAEVTCDATYTATFTETVNKYTIKFVNEDGTELQSSEVEYGETPAYTGETPTKTAAANETGTYTFTGWDPEVAAVTGNATYTAQFSFTGWRKDDNGRQYYEDNVYKTGWTKLDDGNWYYFYPETGYAATGYAMVPYAPEETGHTYGPYVVDLNPDAGHPEYAALYAENGEFVFDENGVFQLNQTGKIMKNGSEWWCQNGEIIWHARLVTDGTYFYYGSAGGSLKRSCSDYIGDTNDLLPAGTYTFDDEARIIMYNGIVTLEDGKWYYENGRRIYKGLFEEPAGSDIYYYAASDGRIICGQDYYVTKTNNLFAAGNYTFDAEGRMILNGLYWQGETLWYYKDGVKNGAGLIKVGDDYYYIKTNGAAVLDADYYVAKTNDLMPKGVYHFNEDGTMVIPEVTVKNGLIWEDGKLWYYEDNVRTHAGLIYVDGYYYYIKSNGQAVTDCDYFVSNTNDFMPRATHHFDAAGHMTDVPPAVKDGLILENGKLWYYENGVKTHPGLIKIDGDYYYICTSGYAVTDCDYYISNTNGLMEKGTYHFGSDGKMVVPEAKNGLIEEGGELVYYVDGVKNHAGLIEINGNYYYIKSNCTAVRNCDYFVSETNGIVPRGTYHFNADGTMVMP